VITNLLSIFFGDPRDVPWNQEDYILEVLAREGREMYALEIVKASKRVSRGVIYIVLTRMVTKGYLSARIEDAHEQRFPGPKRRIYKITENGLRWRSLRCARVPRPA
jgi:DNA-binding PadR family transcriptional regulator